MTVKNIVFIRNTVDLLGVNIKKIDIFINTPIFLGVFCNICKILVFFYELLNFTGSKNTPINV